MCVGDDDGGEGWVVEEGEFDLEEDIFNLDFEAGAGAGAGTGFEAVIGELPHTAFHANSVGNCRSQEQELSLTTWFWKVVFSAFDSARGAQCCPASVFSANTNLALALHTGHKAGLLEYMQSSAFT